MRRGLAALAVVLVAAPAAVAAPAPVSPLDELGTWAVAYAEWRLPATGDTVRAIELVVTQHRALDGRVTTAADVSRLTCVSSGGMLGCGGQPVRLHRIRFAHDIEATTATLTAVMPHGRKVTARWSGSARTLPDGWETDRTACLYPDGTDDGPSTDYSVTRPAHVTARMRGRTWGSRHLAWAYLGTGAGTRPHC